MFAVSMAGRKLIAPPTVQATFPTSIVQDDKPGRDGVSSTGSSGLRGIHAPGFRGRPCFLVNPPGRR